jgi:CDP-diacylglycerol--glycerol-3-phosphate 3-phosphatidyltransferase
MANLITIGRFPLIIIYLFILYYGSITAQIWNVPFIVIIIILDAIDGWVARKRSETSLLGSVLDIAMDRTLEYLLWVVYAHLGLISISVPIIVLTRGVTVDALRSVGMKSGISAFDQIQSPLNRFLVSSRFMRGFYGTVKATAAALLTFTIPLSRLGSNWSQPIYAAGLVFTWISVITCLLRGIPVLVEGFQTLSKQENSLE